MNALGFVFSILLILSFGFALCLERQTSSNKLRSNYLGHSSANRKILSQSESMFYVSLPSKPPVEQLPKKEPSQNPKRKNSSLPKINPRCASVNLFPLIGDAKEKNPLLYETTARLLKVFYGETLFENKPHAEIHFLNAWLGAMKLFLENNASLILEKVQFKNPNYQTLYYKMLKGTKNPLEGYPSLLEYVKVDPISSKICTSHAHPFMLSILFGSKPSLKIYETIHAKQPHPPVTQETIERICSEEHTPIYNKDIFALVELSSLRHKKDSKTVLVGEDRISHISLKKTVKSYDLSSKDLSQNKPASVKSQ
jgi:hypothetical protein